MIDLPRSLGLALALAALAPAAQARTLGELAFTKCELPVVGMRPTNPINAECTTLSVPENWAAPEGRKIELAIAIIPSRSPKPKADPVFMLAGGPGQGARESWRAVAGAFRNILAERNVVLLDQRGTGASARFDCPNDPAEDPLSTTPPAEVTAAMAKACVDSVAGKYDPRYFTTEDAARDLDHVRAKIGAPQVNLVGVSYGTRMAQIYYKRYPDKVRTLMLDSMVPNELILGTEHAINLENSLKAQLTRCTADEECHARFGDPFATLQALHAELVTPRPIAIRNPLTGVTENKTLNRGALAMVARMYAYSAETMALLPVTLAEAREGRFEPLVTQALMMSDDLGSQISMGMHWSVVCTEDSRGYAPRPQDAGLLMGQDFIEVTQTWCAQWPKVDVAADFHEPISGPVPALLLSGEFDPVTPPSYGVAIAKTLPNSRHLIAPGQGHSVMGRGCLPRLVTEFIQSADASKLKPECLAELAPAPFFLNLSGAAP
jgi:pimeloyl-ACP methyl ester carboxylesterase